MEDKIKIFKALGDETRINILHLINKKSMCAKGIARELSISESAVSQQIKILRDANLVIGYKIGYHIVYDLNIEQLESINILIDYIVNDDNNIKIKENIYEKCNKICKHAKCINNKNLKEENIMRICFPVKNNEGVKSVPYGHFGTAPTFVICDLEKDEVTTVGNGDLGHEHGKCQPIKALSGEIVDAVVVGGIGAGAISKLNSMGIKVYKAIDGDIEANLEALKKGELKEFSSTHTCNHHGCSH
ncbi:metalloregulator ArsR/SmtB family transcription factor [Clostridium perfringens]|uniref:metalloregulator ArsR/SmtB family transcription factor n=1 Tax=Clostridium perfringens TaxID=1502 RepID=UPI001120F0DF|nr:metalloregulator ArsR/SmtB family transcription factor [Clostridium perfringens]